LELTCHSHGKRLYAGLGLRSRFPVIRLRLRLQEGFEPLKKLGSVHPKINLEILSTKKRENMFNNGFGFGVGVKIDLRVPYHLKRLR
jgi:hypothetical protein